jgi:acyl dehydratase
MRFVDLVPGLQIQTDRYCVTEAEIVRFAREWDPLSFHVDPQFARASRWGGLIASGWHTAVIAMKLVVAKILLNSDTIGSPGLENIEWLAPVRPGDEVRVRVTILSTRISSSGEYGIIRWQWEMTNQTGILVFSLLGTGLFAMRPEASNDEPLGAVRHGAT